MASAEEKRETELSGIRRKLMSKAGIRPRDLVLRWGIKSPTVTGIITGRSRSSEKEHDLADLLSESLGRSIAWGDIFDPPSYTRLRPGMIPNPQDRI